MPALSGNARVVSGSCAAEVQSIMSSAVQGPCLMFGFVLLFGVGKMLAGDLGEGLFRWVHASKAEAVRRSA